ncbi:hypothetical protein LU689_11585 [Pseudomonas asiatica]|uniref:hypothetical protein n=1 Tax=Pseudomonas asiatica TaxID=2219225 RepID=UPI001E5468D5|nr:hypothetical protein [Pseudomonas asiatica]
MAVPDPPEIDGVTAEVLEAYGHIGRSRQYVGMVGAPAPISPSAITEYLDRYPSAICREEFEAAIFALDDEFRKHWDEQQEKERPKTPPKKR